MSEKWIVERIEMDGHPRRTVELPEDEATALYNNWCGNIKTFNDQSVSLIRVERAEKVISTHVNTEMRTV